MRVFRGVMAFGALIPALYALDAGAAPLPLHVVVTSQVARSISLSMPLVRLHLSHPVALATLPQLHLTPALATRWVAIGPSEVEALATQNPAPAVSYTIAVPTGLNCTTTCLIVATQTVRSVVTLNVTWTEQLLAELDYLPVSFHATSGTDSSLAQVLGTFAWRFPHLPAALTALWRVGVDNVVLRGALMRFQDAHSLATSGTVDAPTWNALVTAVQSHHLSATPYNYVSVTESSPESMTLFEDGVATQHALINTGIAQSPTVIGTYPVYLRYTSQTMRGTNPDGTKYVDPGIPWISYFYGGDALHGYLRSSYGFPQSLGCVEMPYATAGTLWPHTPIGTLVSVSA